MDFSLTLFELVLMRAHVDTVSVYSVVEDGDPDPQPGKKGEMVRGWLNSHACILGLPGQVNKFDSNRPFVAVIETA